MLVLLQGNVKGDVRLQKTIYSKKYGVDLIRFTHHPDAVITASKNGWDGAYADYVVS